MPHRDIVRDGHLHQALAQLRQLARPRRQVSMVLPEGEGDAVHHHQANGGAGRQGGHQPVHHRQQLRQVVHAVEVHRVEHALTGEGGGRLGAARVAARRGDAAQVGRQRVGHLRQALQGQAALGIDVQRFPAQPPEAVGDLDVQGQLHPECV